MTVKYPTNIEQTGVTKKGSDYWKVTWSDSKFSNIFDLHQKVTIDQAIKDECGVDVTFEKKGDYWNITNITLEYGSPSNPPPPPFESPPVIVAKGDPVKPSGQEIGLAWKLLADSLANGLVSPETDRGKIYRLALFAQIDSVLGIEIEK